MGYGRSGTTMMLNIFERDNRIETLGENDSKIAKNFMLIYEKLNPAIENSRAQVLVMKPILNSFDASRILEEYNNAKIIWMIRNYKDVIASAIKKFGPIVANYMKNYVLYNKKGNNWISSGLPDNTLKILNNLDTTEFTMYDWMALVWWSVNRTVIIDKLFKSDRFFLLSYEKLVSEPDLWLKLVYEFIGLPYNFEMAKYIHSASVGKGAPVQLSHTITKMCDDLTREFKSAGAWHKYIK